MLLPFIRDRRLDSLCRGTGNRESFVIVQEQHLSIDKYLEAFFRVIGGSQRRVG